MDLMYVICVCLCVCQLGDLEIGVAARVDYKLCLNEIQMFLLLSVC